MARFLVLIYGEEATWAAASPEWDAENGRRHRDFLDKAGAAVLMGGDVVPSTHAVSIRGDEPGTRSPGPFVQADKGIGGFYVIEAAGLDHAVEIASGIPETSNPHSGVEVRQLG